MSDSKQGDFQEISPNPYIVGNPVRDPTMFFGREAEFEFVRQRFHGSPSGMLLVFCGDRRSGKTSILFQILEGRLGTDFIPVLIDLQSMAIRGEADFLARIADEIILAVEGEGVRVARPDFTSKRKPSEVFRAFMQDTRAACPQKKPILMFDEYELFEDKIDAGILTDDLLYMFSHLMEKYPIFFVFMGEKNLVRKQRPYWKILGRSHLRTISYLKRDDAMRLIRNPVKGRVFYDEATDESIFRLSAGQPFYTQALCQRLVDHLNEARTNRATQELLAEAVQDVINPPPPPLLHLWDSLGDDEKLVLALLSEQLEEQDSTATAKELVSLAGRRRYPLDLDEPRASTALERLFEQELLTKTDRIPAGYASRMDILRRWVRVMHSPWQVMRELGIKFRRKGRVRPVVVFSALAVVGLLVLGLRWLTPSTQEAQAPIAADLRESVRIDIPDAATLLWDGTQIGGVGKDFDRNLDVGVKQRITVGAVGFRDSTFEITPVKGEPISLKIELPPVFGFVSVTTTPAGAQVRIGDEPGAAGPSPLNARLRAEHSYVIRATLRGYANAEEAVHVEPGQEVSRHLVMQLATVDVTVTSTPLAEIQVDGEPKGRAPLVVRLELGTHQFRASKVGYKSKLEERVIDETTTVQLNLEPEPGELEVWGITWGVISLNGDRGVQGQNRKVTGLKPGKHWVQVKFQNQPSVEESVTVFPGYRTKFNYTTRDIVKERLGES